MLLVGILGLLEKTTPLQNFLIFVACAWSFFSNARESFLLVFPQGAILYPDPVAVGGLGWAFVGEVASQKLRARTAGIAAGVSVLFGLTFNTTVPLMRE